MTQEALKLALEALSPIAHNTTDDPRGQAYKAITAIKEALAQPEQEPVAYLCENAVGHKYFRWKKPSSTYKPIALYTAPPQRTWVGLTNEDISEIVRGTHNTGSFVRAIEAKLKERNT